MNKLSDTEIVKALEDAMNIGDAPIGKYWGCIITKQVAKETLALINRQQAAIAELKEKNSGLVLGLLYEVVNEDEQLRNEITKVAVSEALEEFAERVKELIPDFLGWGLANMHSKIDNLLKEMGV